MSSSREKGRLGALPGTPGGPTRGVATRPAECRGPTLTPRMSAVNVVFSPHDPTPRRRTNPPTQAAALWRAETEAARRVPERARFKARERGTRARPAWLYANEGIRRLSRKQDRRAGAPG